MRPGSRLMVVYLVNARVGFAPWPKRAEFGGSSSSAAESTKPQPISIFCLPKWHSSNLAELSSSQPWEYLAACFYEPTRCPFQFCLLQRHVKTSENIQNATDRQLAALSTTWCVNRSGRCAVGAMGAHWYCPESARLIFMWPCPMPEPPTPPPRATRHWRSRLGRPRLPSSTASLGGKRQALALLRRTRAGRRGRRQREIHKRGACPSGRRGSSRRRRPQRRHCRQAGSEVDREAAVVDRAEPAEEVDDGVQR